MNTRPKTWNLDTIRRRESKINPKPPYQRSPVWSPAKKQLLIDSILRGYDIPKLYLRASTEPIYEHEVVDGQQRLRAIWEFLRDDYELGEDSSDLPQGNLVGLRFSALKSDVQDQLSLHELSIVIIEDASELEVRDLFLRLQEGVTLNPAERRNAMAGKMRDFVAETAESHKVFPLTEVASKRFAWHDLVALVTCLELNGGPCDIKAPSLKAMYSNENGKFDPNGAVAKRITRILNIMAKVLAKEPPEMDIKWGFVDLYLLISRLEGEYVIAKREDEIAQAFIAFEQERRLWVSDPADLLGKNDSWKEDLFRYIQAFEVSGGTRASVETRHDVYVKHFLRDIPDLSNCQ